MRFSRLIPLVVLLGIWGCTRTIDLAPPNYVREPVVAALLHPDSSIQIQLTYSFPASAVDPIPAPIQGAKVYLSEDGQLLSPLVEQSPGIYRLNERPKVGGVYAMTAITPEGVTLTAQDRVPNRPTLTARLTEPNPGNANNSPDIVLSLSPFESSSAVQWLSVYRRLLQPLGGLPPIKYEFQTWRLGVESNSLLLDEFNSDLSGFNFKRFYSPFARIKPVAVQTLDDPTLIFNTYISIREIDQAGEFYQLTIWMGSLAFDEYLRSTIVAEQNQLSSNEGIGDNLFVQPSPVWSNITNGKGIFAAYSTQLIMLKEGGK
jgi:hypothetical protein